MRDRDYPGRWTAGVGLAVMGGRQLLDPRWHWMQNAVRKLYAELEEAAKPAVLSVIAANGDELISYSICPGDRDDIDRRIITGISALTEAVEATTVNANVELWLSL